MRKPVIDSGWLSLEEARQKYGHPRSTIYRWEKKGLLRLKRFPAGRPAVFVNEAELTELLNGNRTLPTIAINARDRAALNTDALKKLWDNDVDAIYDQIDWRTGRRATT